mgnify:CR=1 FL=1
MEISQKGAAWVGVALEQQTMNRNYHIKRKISKALGIWLGALLFVLFYDRRRFRKAGPKSVWRWLLCALEVGGYCCR